MQKFLLLIEDFSKWRDLAATVNYALSTINCLARKYSFLQKQLIVDSA
jgi:hypothetical protein